MRFFLTRDLKKKYVKYSKNKVRNKKGGEIKREYSMSKEKKCVDLCYKRK